MRYSVLGFNQAKVMETDLDLTDLMLLNYIINACGTPNMRHKLDSNGNPLVWLSHSKLIEDLPIIRISEGTLKNRLTKLRQGGYINSIMVAGEIGRGSRTYYGITEMTTSLIYDTEMVTTSQKNDVETRPRHEKMTPDNLLNNDNRLKDTISKDIVQPTPEKPKKQNMYDKCVSLIKEYTDDTELQELLTEYLKMRLAMKDKPLYGANQFKGILNKLKTIGGNPFEIVNYCIERGYASFYAPTSYGNGNNMERRLEKFGEHTSMLGVKKLADKEKENEFTGAKV